MPSVIVPLLVLLSCGHPGAGFLHDALSLGDKVACSGGGCRVKHQVNGKSHILPVHDSKRSKSSRHVDSGVDGELHVRECINP